MALQPSDLTKRGIKRRFEDEDDLANFSTPKLRRLADLTCKILAERGDFLPRSITYAPLPPASLLSLPLEVRQMIYDLSCTETPKLHAVGAGRRGYKDRLDAMFETGLARYARLRIKDNVRRFDIPYTFRKYDGPHHFPALSQVCRKFHHEITTDIFEKHAVSVQLDFATRAATSDPYTGFFDDLLPSSLINKFTTLNIEIHISVAQWKRMLPLLWEHLDQLPERAECVIRVVFEHPRKEFSELLQARKAGLVKASEVVDQDKFAAKFWDVTEAHSQSLKHLGAVKEVHLLFPYKTASITMGVSFRWQDIDYGVVSEKSKRGEWKTTKHRLSTRKEALQMLRLGGIGKNDIMDL